MQARKTALYARHGLVGATLRPRCFVARNLGLVPQERHKHLLWSHRRRARARLRSHSYRRRIHVAHSSGAQDIPRNLCADMLLEQCASLPSIKQYKLAMSVSRVVSLAGRFSWMYAVTPLVVLGLRAAGLSPELGRRCVDWPKPKAASTAVDMCARELEPRLRPSQCSLWV